MAKQRHSISFAVDALICIEALKNFDPVFYLGNSNSSNKQLLAIGVIGEFKPTRGKSFSKLQEYQQKLNDWCFGWINYDLKNELEDLNSNNPSYYNNDPLVFVQPEIVFEIEDKKVKAHFFKDSTTKNQIEELVNAIWTADNENVHQGHTKRILFNPTLSKAEYINRVNEVKKHIKLGDIYEANFCQIFTAEGEINPYSTYKKLLELSATPFSSFVQYGQQYTLCASPERFVKKEGSKIICEPIKGTISRGSNSEEDKLFKEQLYNSEKDRTENVMIVDLVRNDLSKVAKKGSVNVEELFGIYSFPQVHQMISRVVCETENNSSDVEVIEALFPIPSMTGVPKISALQILEELENFKRELYAGCIGYFTPTHDFDFNVVIRSLCYNQNSKQLSYAVGGAIIDASDPEEEYQETLLKAQAIQGLFN